MPLNFQQISNTIARGARQKRMARSRIPAQCADYAFGREAGGALVAATGPMGLTGTVWSGQLRRYVRTPVLLLPAESRVPWEAVPSSLLRPASVDDPDHLQMPARMGPSRDLADGTYRHIGGVP